MRYALHYGIAPVGEGDTPAVYGHEDPATELETEVLGHRAIVSGSWACWGPADQDTDGDQTLHVVVYVEGDEDEAIAAFSVIGIALGEYMGRGSRLMDYGVISDADSWSEDQAIVLRDGGSLYIPVPQP